jgi:outer membrane protein OmpA-like peptidoglycan-associated protein
MAPVSPFQRGKAKLCRSVVAIAIALPSLLAAGQAQATDVELHLDPGVAFPLGSPQTDHFGVGSGGWLGGDIQVWKFFHWEANAGFLALSQGNEGGSVGEAFTLGTGPRLQRPRKDGWSPWIDADPLYVRTGSLDRFGVTVGAGVAFPLREARDLWLGPYVRYLQVVQDSTSDPIAVNSADARILAVGLSLEWSTPYHPPPPALAGPPQDYDGDGLVGADDLCPYVAGPVENHGCPDVDTDGDGVVDRLDQCPKVPGPPSNHGCPYADTDGDGLTDDIDRCPNEPGPKDLRGCPDRDKDGVPDIDDQCPDKPGPIENHGCPVYKLVVVTGQKVEIKQKILFAFGSSKILAKSFPLLNEVTEALKDHSALQVRIEGHTDSVGGDAQNLKLSKERAASVMAYLVEHGIAGSRLTSEGFGKTQPLESNATVDGREANRRVEFVITGGNAVPKTEQVLVPTPTNRGP